MTKHQWLSKKSRRFRVFGVAGLFLCLLSGCGADYAKLLNEAEASSCAAWLTGNTPLENPPTVDIVSDPLVVRGQLSFGAAYPKLNHVRVTEGAPEETATRLVHEMAHIYGADEIGADFAARNAWRCAVG